MAFLQSWKFEVYQLITWKKWFFLIKTRDGLWTFLVYLITIEQRPVNILMIGKHWNNQYCYNRLILENSIKITKIKIMRWEADKAWLYEWCNDYTTIEYQVAIDEKAGVIEIKTKYFNDVNFAVLQPQNSRFYNIYFWSLQGN